MGLSIYCLSLQLLILVQFSPRISAIRKDVGFLPGKPFCRSTVQGRYLLSDDNGHVCDALSVDPQSRCCPQTGEKFSLVATCNLVSQCCDSYEYCVSCCLHPSRGNIQVYLISVLGGAGIFLRVWYVSDA